MSVHRVVFLTAALAAIVPPLKVQAQEAASGSAGVSRVSPIVVPGYPYPYSYSPYFSSTNAEGLGRGLGAFANGIGQMNLNNSIAAANFQEARRRAIENRRVAVENYFALQRLNEEYREAQLHRRRNQLSTEPSDAAATRPVIRAFDRTSKTVRWPEPLLSEEFDGHRERVETLLAAQRESKSGLSLARQRQLQGIVEDMRELLRTHVRDMNSDDYVAAKRFIDDLAAAIEPNARSSERLAGR
jgi:hypothetical protein